MPSKDMHMLMDFHFFGVPYGSTEYIHDIIDHGINVGIDYQRLFSTKHRHFMHNDIGIKWIEANYGLLAGCVARLHICLDIVSSREKREMNAGRNNRNNRR